VHELSIAMSIIDIACEEAHRLAAQRVRAVHLKLGQLSGVVRRALESAYEMAVEQSEISGARLVIEEVPVAIYCRRCDGERPARSIQEMCCATCGEPSYEVVRGRDLEVVRMEIDP